LGLLPLARGIPQVVALNAGKRVRNAKIKTQKENSGPALAFHFSARTANGQTIASGELEGGEQTGLPCWRARRAADRKRTAQYIVRMTGAFLSSDLYQSHLTGNIRRRAALDPSLFYKGPQNLKSRNRTGKKNSLRLLETSGLG